MLNTRCSFIILLAFVSVGAVHPSTAQEPYYIRRTLDRGLPSNVIMSILPSRSGLVWIATDRGLCVFDGAVLREVPRPKNAEIRSLLSVVEACAEDSTGALWFGTRFGLMRYIPQMGAWQQFLPDVELSKEYSFVSVLICDHSGTLWIGTRGGLLRFDPKQNRCVMATPLLRSKGVYHLHEDACGHLWTGAWEEPPMCYDIARKEWRTMPPSLVVASGIASITAQGGFFCHEVPDVEGCIVSPILPKSLQTQAPLRAVVKDGSVVWQNSPAAPCAALTEGFQKGTLTYLWADEKSNAENKGFVWAVVNVRPSSPLAVRHSMRRTLSGLYCIHPEASVLPFEPLVRGAITVVRRDRQGRLWVGTEGNGCVLLLPTGTQRLSNHAEIGTASALHRDHQGRLWCGTERGVMLRLPEDTATWKRIPTRFPAFAPASMKLSVLDIHETPDGRILIGTNVGLGEFDEERKVIIPLMGFVRTVRQTQSNSIGDRVGDRAVKKILSDRRDSSLWLVMPRIGVVHCDKDGRELQRWEQRGINDPDDVQKLSSATVFSLYQDHIGGIWIGTLNGIDRLNPATKLLEHFTRQPNTTSATQILTVTAFTKTVTKTKTETLHEQKTEAPAVTAVAYGTGLIESFGTPQARLLPLSPLIQDAQILGLATIGNEYWWSTYANMVARTRWSNSRSVERMIVEEILPAGASSLASPVNDTQSAQEEFEDVEFTYTYRHIANVGTMSAPQPSRNQARELLFDYNGDAMRLSPSMARVFSDTAHIVPLAWYCNDTLMAGAPHDTGDTLTVPMNASFGVECGLVSFAHPSRHRLYYRLEGLEDAWSLAQSSTMRMIRYAAMPPGVYRLVIRSFSADDSPNNMARGLFSNNTLMITILVPTPWYLLLWVQGLAAVLIMSGVAAGIRMVERKRAEKRSALRLAEEQRAREKEQVERLLVEFQLKTLRLQMDPHFMFNALTLLQELTLENPEQAAEYIAIFADILRKMLEQSGKHLISVREECALLERYMELEEMRNEWKMDYEFHLFTPSTDASHWETLTIPPFIVQPYLENAIRHGIRPMLQTNATVHRRGKVIVELHDEGTHLRCVVEDNGIGRAEAARIKLARKTAHQHLSIATTVTAERLRLLQEVYQIHLNVTTDDLTDDNGTALGTRVTVLIPYHQ